jgi:hypothetical protein
MNPRRSVKVLRLSILFQTRGNGRQLSLVGRVGERRMGLGQHPPRPDNLSTCQNEKVVEDTKFDTASQKHW